MPLKIILKVSSAKDKQVINYELQTDLPAFLLTSKAHLLCCLPLGEDMVPQVVILGEAERVSENLSDAQCYLKKKKKKKR